LLRDLEYTLSALLASREITFDPQRLGARIDPRSPRSSSKKSFNFGNFSEAALAIPLWR
jgi:hypothetical protein